jgi:hypothetical protein
LTPPFGFKPERKELAAHLLELPDAPQQDDYLFKVKKRRRFDLLLRVQTNH